MKVILFFLPLLFVETSIAQLPSLNLEQHITTSELSSLLQGDWYLNETEFVDGHGRDTDSSRFFSYEYENRKIVFKEDLLKVFPDSTARFYSGRVRNFKFRLDYDSISNANQLKVFSIRKRKSEELESYEIIKCEYDELVFKTTKYLNTTLDQAMFSIYTVYRRKGVDSILNIINGYWYHCSTDYYSLGYDSTNISEITFTRKKNDSLCGEHDHRLELNFHRKHYEKQCSISSFTKYTGAAYRMNFMLDPENNTLYLYRSGELLAYDILTLNRDELKIALNREKTHNSK